MTAVPPRFPLSRLFVQWLTGPARTGPFWPVFLTLCSGVTLVCVLVHRHLYADGAAFLDAILNTKKFMNFDIPRQFATYVLEAPLVAALGAGITQVQVLSWVFGLSLFLPPVLSLWACWHILRHRNRSLLFLPALCWIGLSLTSSFFIISESWLGVALFWPLYFLLAFRHHRLSLLASLFLVAGAVLSIRVYEAFCLPSALLCFLALRRFHWQRRRGAHFEGETGFAAVCLACASLLGVWWGLHPRLVASQHSLFGGIAVLLVYPGALLFLGVLGLMAGSGRPGPRLPERILAGAGLIWAGVAWCSSFCLFAWCHYHLRLLNTLLPFGLGILPLLAARRPALRPTFNGYRRQCFVGIALVALVWQAGSCWSWQRNSERFACILKGHSGEIPFEATGLSGAGLTWGWTMPAHSRVLDKIHGIPVSTLVCNPVKSHKMAGKEEFLIAWSKVKGAWGKDVRGRGKART